MLREDNPSREKIEEWLEIYSWYFEISSRRGERFVGRLCSLYDLPVPIKILPRKEALLHEAVPRLVPSWSCFGSPAAKLIW